MKVLFLDTVHPILARRLTEAGMDCIDATDAHPLEGIHQHPDAGGIVLRSRIRVDADLLDRLPELRFICRSGAGLENIDVGLAEMRGIRVFNSPEGNRDAVGEHELALSERLAERRREAAVQHLLLSAALVPAAPSPKSSKGSVAEFWPATLTGRTTMAPSVAVWRPSI